jgi:hypothetical protein
MFFSAQRLAELRFASLIVIGLLVTALFPISAADVEISLAPYATRNIQANLFPTFPTGHVIPPKNSFGVPFYIPASGKNFLPVERDSPVTIHVGVFGVKKIFALIQAYGPHEGDRICSVEFIGSAGADQTFNLIVGFDIRDFFESGFSRTINNTTTCPAFEFIGRGGAYGDDTATGPRGFYDFDEHEFDLNKDFANQTLDSIKFIKLTDWGTPMLLGLTAQTVTEPEPSLFLSFRFWLIVGACLLILAFVGVVMWIRHWLDAP